MIAQNLVNKFIDSFTSTDDLATEILAKQQTISLSLKQLSKLHHLQRMLEEFQFLNIVYSDSSRVRKMIVSKTTTNLDLQHLVCSSIDNNINQFMRLFSSLDQLAFSTLNSEICQENSLEFLRMLSSIILGTDEFTVMVDLNNSLNVLTTEGMDSHEQHTNLEKLKESGKYSGKQLGLKDGEYQVYRNKYSCTIYPIRHIPWQSFSDNRLIMDQFISIVCDFQKEIYDKSNLVTIIRGIKSQFIRNSNRICQEIIRVQIAEGLNCKCWIEMPDQIQYMHELTITQNGCIIMPVKYESKTSFYIKIEQPCIDMITFSDFIQQLWLKQTFQLKDLKNEDFLRQMLEVNLPQKLILQFDPDCNIRYQSCSVPQSWPFIMIKGASLNEMHMEEVYKQNLILKIQELKSSNKGGINVGQIHFADKSVELELFAKRNEEEDIHQYYLVFDQPKKKHEEVPSRYSNGCGSEQRLQELTQDAFSNIKNEKIVKACKVLRDYLKISLNDDEISEILREKDIINDVLDHQALTDDIRSSYIMEYYKSESHRQIREPIPEAPYQTCTYIAESQLMNIKKLDLFSIDTEDISKLADYNFDITTVVDQNEQLRYTWALFHLCNFIDIYQISKDTLYQFLVIVQEKYNCRKNPFHNYEHGFTVAHACYFLIKNKCLNQFFEKLIQFTALLSGLCHDIDHSGRTNQFEISRYSKLSIRYNDESVLENHHVSTMFKILQKEKYNILSQLSSEQFLIFRKYAIQNILATDMKKHFEIIKILEVKLSKLPDEPLIQKEDDKKFLSGAIIHTCDLTGQSKTFELAQKFSSRIQQEFSSQVEDEKQLSLPVTQHFLLKTNPNFNQLLAKQEISFIKFIVRPCYELIASALQKGLEGAVENLEQNLKEWEKQANQ